MIYLVKFDRKGSDEGDYNMKEIKNMNPRPVTSSNYINELNPVDAMNFIVWVNEFAVPKVCEQIAEILCSKEPLVSINTQLDEQNQILDSINKDLEAANIVSRWFLEEAPKHIVMMSEENDEIIITYDNEDDWFEIPASNTADNKTKKVNEE